MKYPNITGGNWKVATWTDENYPNGKRVSIHGDGKAIMVAPKYYYTDIEFNANAKAISALPEMIYALIEYVECGAGPTSANIKAKQALEKAGVEL